ncbi:MAG TPA: biliverdin-producing heme oxygenase [Terracidiphilus sp.]|nr:biliverdin-producing heme oxygenase [Terracidiphilus sp.]
MPFMKPDLTREEYVACLQRLHGIVAAWDATAYEKAPSSMQNLLGPRRRGHLLAADLNWFGLTVEEKNRPSLPDLSDEALFFGALYVMEGSTLGGQLIARHVEEALGLEPGRGDRYFRGHGAKTGPMWKEICELLETRVLEEEGDRVIESARQMFRIFESWMRSEG